MNIWKDFNDADELTNKVGSSLSCHIKIVGNNLKSELILLLKVHPH